MYKYLFLLVTLSCSAMQNNQKLYVPLFEEPTILDYQELKDHIILINHQQNEFKEELVQINKRVELLEKLFGMTIVNLRKNKDE